MMPSVFNEKNIFLEALDRSADEREHYLNGACPTPAAKARILRLLSLHDLSEHRYAAATTGDEPIPEHIDEFEIVRVLGRGGMGTVLLAFDTVLRRSVALKIVGAHLTNSEAARSLFEEEAIKTASLKHPGIVPVFKVGRFGERRYLVSEYVEGRTLEALIDERAARGAGLMPRDEFDRWIRGVCDILAKVADAIDYSHRQGIIHCDVKPANILIDPVAGPRLADFGIARRATPLKDDSQPTSFGSPHYMSPEQTGLMNAEIDERCDVFSLGAVLYEAMTFTRAFSGPSHAAVLEAVVLRAPVRPRHLRPQLPRDLETICMIAVEKRPEDRYPTMAHLAADLRCVLEGRPILARPPGIVRRTRRWVARNRSTALTAAVALLLISCGLLWWQVEQFVARSTGWVSVHSDVDACQVYVQAVSPETLELSAARLIGSTPLRGTPVPLGQIRVTVVAPDRSMFAEFDVRTTTGGRAALVQLNARRQPGSGEVNAESPPAASTARPVLSALLVPSNESAHEAMILVPEGDYPFGWSTLGDPLTQQRSVHTGSFLIDRCEVSVREFREFLEATGRPPPRVWTLTNFDASLDARPAVGISLDDAEAYARWRGKRLPTMFEWQAAARGLSGALRPIDHETGHEQEFAGPACEDLLELQSADGDVHFQMFRRRSLDVALGRPDAAGFLHFFSNARELSSTVTRDGHHVAVLGRCWNDDPRRTDLSKVETLAAFSSSFTLGFRCARSVGPPAPSSSASQEHHHAGVQGHQR